MTSKYLYVESWLIQYELRTRRLAHRRPTRSSAVDRRDRWYFSWLIPWLVGLPIEHLCQNRFLFIKATFIFARHTISSTLSRRSLAATSSDSDTVDNVALLGLVPQSSCLVWSRWSRSAVDDVQLSELYYALSANVQRVYSKTRKRCHNSKYAISWCVWKSSHLPAADS